MKIGKKEFDLENHCYVMGILNVTPDSFSDGGKWNRIDAAKKHTGEMIRDGAAIIDIGGESTRPGYQKISEVEEISRVVPMSEMELLDDLRETIAIAKKAGIKDEKIILDPGVGFGKTYEQNLMAIHDLDDMKALGYPILLGTSRKSVVGLTLDLPASERVEGTMVTTVFGVMEGASFVRVHDVKENFRAVQMTEAILHDKKWTVE